MIARNKERKLEKAKGKEEQEMERERLDDEFLELMDIVNQGPAEGAPHAKKKSEADDYDITMRVSYASEM